MKKVLALSLMTMGLLSACGGGASAEPMMVTADELMAAWEADKAPYLGQAVEVTGLVAKSEMVPMVGHKVFLGADPEGWTNFQCVMKMDQVAAAEALTVGAEVTLKGWMTEQDTISASANECEIAE